MDAGKSDVCAVCQDALDERPAVLPCSHSFHAGCVDPWVVKKNTCPLCRAHVLPETIEDEDISPFERDESPSPGDMLDEALRMMAVHEYRRAIPIFEQLSLIHNVMGNRHVVANIQEHIGTCYLALKSYASAMSHFRYMAHYAVYNVQKIRALMMLGVCNLRLDKCHEAVQLLVRALNFECRTPDELVQRGKAFYNLSLASRRMPGMDEMAAQCMAESARLFQTAGASALARRATNLLRA